MTPASPPSAPLRHALHRVGRTWLALIALMLASLGSAYLPLGAGNVLAGLGIAVAKSALVVVVFMALGRSGTLSRIAVAIGLCTLALLAGLSAVDYATRERMPAPMQTPQQVPPSVPQSVPDPSVGHRR